MERARARTDRVASGLASRFIAISFRQTTRPSCLPMRHFPGLLQTAMGTVFPTYLAHLFGKKPRHPLTLELACVKVANGRSAPLRARLRVGMPVYAQPSSQDLTVPPGQAVSACLDPTFDL